MRRVGPALIAALLVLLAPALAGATVFTPRDFPTPEHEKRYRAIVAGLRCLVCQNQNIADSNADLAADLRRKVFEMVVGGAGDDVIIDYMVARYGDFVLYQPPLRPATVALWFGPFVLCAVGLAVVARQVRRRKARATPLPEAERLRIEAALGVHPDEPPGARRDG